MCLSVSTSLAWLELNNPEECGTGLQMKCWWQVIYNYYSSACACSVTTLLTLCDPVDCSPPGSSVCGILQPRILESAAMPSLGTFPTQRSSLRLLECRQILHCWATGEAPIIAVSQVLIYQNKVYLFLTLPFDCLLFSPLLIKHFSKITAVWPNFWTVYDSFSNFTLVILKIVFEKNCYTLSSDLKLLEHYITEFKTFKQTKTELQEKNDTRKLICDKGVVARI